MAGGDHNTLDPGDPASLERSVLLLLDVASGSEADLERYVSQLLIAAGDGTPATGVIVSEAAIGWGRCWEHWRFIVVPDITRVAAALGVMTLPAVVLGGAVEEFRQRIDAIVQRQDRSDGGRVSGALSAGDLR